MSTIIKRIAISILATNALMGVSTVTHSRSPVPLTESQLDGITAEGGPLAEAAGAAAASGLTTLGNTSTVAVTGVGNSPFDGANAQATGVAFGLGMNGVSPGASSTAVTTFAEAPGNFVVNLNYNKTIYGIGATLQIGVSASTGVLVPGLQ
ncbi:MAG: hypothetical protein JO320_22010 [Alphaproteobacteria bacterium]|nr:hypothetical protein [Alphaproteobacteria bacterium]MBV9377687.1 hypothetical protein [Alphaproteobacteria bacterium]